MDSEPIYQQYSASRYVYNAPPILVHQYIESLPHEQRSLTGYTSRITPVKISSNAVEYTITVYNSSVGPVSEDIILETGFDYRSQTVDFIWTNPDGTEYLSGVPSSGDSSWRHDFNDTASSGVGPTSGQVDSYDGYVFTEASSTNPSVVFYTEYKEDIDVSGYVSLFFTFYTNQRGNDNNTTCQPQINVDGGGWVDYGPYFGGPDDPSKVATSGIQIWEPRSVEIKDTGGTIIRLRLKLTFPDSGSIFHNDYGLDTVKIFGNLGR
jgi:hypothetical protein